MFYNTHSKKAADHQYIGLDLLRAIMILFVIAHHTNLFANNYILFRNIRLTDLITYNFLYLGVPGFFLISLFLFSIKAKKDKFYFFKRIEILIYSYIFWSLLWILIYYSKGFHVLKWLLTFSLKDFFYFVAGEGIGIFYFHFSLLILTCVSVLFIHVNRYLLVSLLSISISLFFIIPLTDLSHDPFFSSYWSPFNFLPYVFIGILLSDIFQEKNIAEFPVKIISALTVLYMVFAVGEWYYAIHFDYKLMAYMRGSIIFGTSAIFILSLYVQKKQYLILYLSDNALGIYCLQLFVINAYSAVAEKTPQGDIIYSVCVLFVCLFGSIFLRKAFSKGII